MTQFKPCPFCGGEVESRGYGVIHKNEGRCILKIYCFDQDEWNARPIEDALQARINELEKALYDISNVNIEIRYRTGSDRILDISELASTLLSMAKQMALKAIEGSKYDKG